MRWLLILALLFLLALAYVVAVRYHELPPPSQGTFERLGHDYDTSLRPLQKPCYSDSDC